MSKQAETSYNVLVGFWRVDGTEHSNEVRLTGKGRLDRMALGADLKKTFPNAKEIIPLGTRIELRSNATAFVLAEPGAVLRNIFTSAEGKEDPVKNIGTVWFQGAPFEVLLLFSRANGAVLVNLKPRVVNYGMVRFSNKLNPQRLLSELPTLLAEVFGADARDLKLNIREKV